MQEDASAVIIEKDTYKWRQVRSEHGQGKVMTKKIKVRNQPEVLE